jgi:hypothetical protein
MRKLKLAIPLGLAAAAVLGIFGSGAFAAAPETCSSTISGSHGSVNVQGFCAVVGPVTINGNLTIADGAIFEGFGPAVHVTGNVQVGKGAQLALGYNRGEGVLGPDVVDGNIVANQPLALYVGNSTVHGNLVSNGGGTSDRFFNFPIKDNSIDGNVVIHGWTGGWWGLIANAVGGNVDVSNNTSLVSPAGDCEGTFPTGCDAAAGTDPDAAEVQSRGEDNVQHIHGNLICHGNYPTVQINEGDGGAANVVDGNSIGECAHERVVASNP